MSSKTNYPALKPGQYVTLNRAECGTNLPYGHKNGTGKSRTVLQGQFIFARPSLPISRSRYVPHVGKKQLAKN